MDNFIKILTEYLLGFSIGFLICIGIYSILTLILYNFKTKTINLDHPISNFLIKSTMGTIILCDVSIFIKIIKLFFFIICLGIHIIYAFIFWFISIGTITCYVKFRFSYDPEDEYRLITFNKVI